MVERRRVQALELPEGIRIDGDSRRISPQDASLLAVAFGLSHARIDIPEYWETREVEPIGPAPVTTKIYDDWRNG
jgi:hypothetical protein